MPKDTPYKQLQQGEGDVDFPLVCETCLGDNPYVRMTKEPYGKKCQVCETPFTVFAWQAGTKGRLKRVEICKNCAIQKNVCQVCIYDLQFGLPVKVRDKVLKECGATSSAIAVPQSRANRSWYTAQQNRLIENGQSNTDSITNNELALAKLREMAQMKPKYERNMAKLCSFFAKGECNRGDSCPFRHEMPRDRNDPLSKQSTRDRFHGTADPVANKILGRKRRLEAEQAKQEQKAGFDKSPCTLYFKFASNEHQGNNNGQPTTTTAYPKVTEADVRDAMYSFGEIVSIRLQPAKGQGFVEYSQPQAAELAIASLNKTRALCNHLIYVNYARAPKRGEAQDDDAIAPPPRTKRGEKPTIQSGTSVVPIAIPPPPPQPPSKKQATMPPLPPQLLSSMVKPSSEVAAIAAARRQARAANNDNSNSNSNSAPTTPTTTSSSSKRRLMRPAYPSTNPSRLGSKTT